MDPSVEQRRRFIARTISLIAPCLVLVLWVFESRTGLISDADRYGYPYLLALFCGKLAIEQFTTRARYAIDVAAYIGVCAYFVAVFVSVLLLHHGPITLYTVANAILWMPLLYVAAFAVFEHKLASILSGSVFAACLIPCVAVTVLYGTAFWDPLVAGILINAGMVHLLCLLSLSMINVLSRQFRHATHTAKALEIAAYTDSLTGITNRRGAEQILRTLAGTPGLSVYLIMLDIDHFKQVNDTYGHAVGDEVLRHVAGHIHSRLRPQDMLARWGGEEFLAIIPVAGQLGASTLRSRVGDMVADCRHPVVGDIHFSGGVAQWSTDSPSATALQAADAALYNAKSLGRNCVLVA